MATTRLLSQKCLHCAYLAVSFCFGVVFLTCLTGCGGGADGRQMAPVSGKVTYRGKELDHGQVVLVHDSGQIGSSEIRADGSYQLEAQVGLNRVMITCTDYPEYAKAHPENPDRLRIEKSLIPAKYTNYNTSGLSIDVAAGQNQRTLVLSD
jgi:hypothetical protein